MNHNMNRRHFLKTSAVAAGRPALGRLPVANARCHRHRRPLCHVAVQTISPVSSDLPATTMWTTSSRRSSNSRADRRRHRNRPVLIKPQLRQPRSTALADTPVSVWRDFGGFEVHRKTDVTSLRIVPGGLLMTAFLLIITSPCSRSIRSVSRT